MARYDPVRMEYTTRAILACAIAREVAEGRGSKNGGVYISVTHLPSNLLDQIEIIQHFKEDFNINLKKECLEYGPIAHYQIGGVKINEKCETTLEGLYAAGECAGGIHGSNRLGADAISDVLVFGCLAGKFAAMRAKNLNMPHLDENQVKVEQDRIFSYLKVGEGPRPWTVKIKLQDLMQQHAGLYKTKDGLYKILQWIDKAKKDVMPNIMIRSDTKIFNTEWKEALELVNMLEVAEMICKASLMRTETRPTHQRGKYRNRDDKNWWKNIVIKQKDGEMYFETRPVVTTRITSIEEFLKLEMKEKMIEALQPRWW